MASRIHSQRRNQNSISRRSLAAGAVLAAAISSQAQAQLYWSLAGGTGGAGGATPAGTWDVGTNWNPLADGTGTPQAWVDGSAAVFAAGNDAIGPYLVNLAAAQNASSITVGEGSPTLGFGSNFNITLTGTTATNIVDVAAGSTLTMQTPLNGTGWTKSGPGTMVLAANSAATGDRNVTGGAISIDSNLRLADLGKLTLDGGTAIQTNPGNAGSFIRAGTALHITANGGTVNYSSTGAGTVSIYSGTITGDPGSVLYKTGSLEFRYQNTGLPNTTFSKLVVKGGLYRLGSAAAVADERGFGATPAGPTDDAITLDGGAIGTSFATTLNTDRGITLGAGNGTITATAAAIVIPSKISGSGGITYAGAVTVRGTNTYTGSTTVLSGTTVLGLGNAIGDQSAVTVTSPGILNVSGTTETIGSLAGTGNVTLGAAGQLTTGGNDQSTAYSGIISSGTSVTKVGLGKWTLGGANTFGSAVNINGGTVSISSDGNLGNIANAVNLNGGALELTAAITSGRSVSVGPSNGTIDTTTFDSSLTVGPQGNGTLHKTGVGKLSIPAAVIEGLAVDGGRVQLPAGRNTANTSKVTSLSVAPGATLDLNDQDLVANTAGISLATLQALLAQGYNGGNWLGTGIASTAANTANTSNPANPVGLGYGDNAFLGYAGSYSGVPVSPTSLIVRYTYSGDANLDGSVDTVDFGLLAASFGEAAQVWTDGDFDFNGSVDTVDFGLLAANFGLLLTAPDASLGTLVPEPSSIALLSVGLLARRRRPR